MFLQPPPQTEASEQLAESDLRDMGYVMNLTRAWGWRPDLSTAFAALRSQLIGQSTLSPREVAVVVCAVASALGDAYCSLAWGTRLAATSDAATAADVLQGRSSSQLSRREAALRGWAQRVACDPNGTTEENVQHLRDSGLSDQDIFDATALAALRLAFSTVNDALGVRPDRQIAEAAPDAVRQVVRYGRACSR